MSHEVENAIYLRKPAWHRLGVVVDEWPGSWAEARKLGGLDWDPQEAPLTAPVVINGQLLHVPVGGYNRIIRDDKQEWIRGVLDEHDYQINPESQLAIQPSSYKVITNEAFGRVIEYVVGEFADRWKYETLLCLSGGRSIVALLRSREPLNIGADPSKTFQFLCLMSRHDGQGGLKGIPTNFRVECANMRKAAESQAKREGVGFVIKHTASWEDQLGKARAVVTAAVRDGQAWEQLAMKLGGAKLTPMRRDKMLSSLFVTDSAMSDRQFNSMESNRAAVREILASPTCEGIEKTLLGFVQAVDEWCDHVRPARNAETRTVRSLLRADPVKTRAMRLCKVN